MVFEEGNGLDPIDWRPQHIREPRFGAVWLQFLLVLPARGEGQRHQDTLDSAGGPEAEQRAAIVDEVELDVSPGVEFPSGGEVNVLLSSDNPFSLLYNAAGTDLWAAFDLQKQATEHLLTETLILSRKNAAICFGRSGQLARGRPTFA